MEPITHFLTGASLARCGLNRTTAYATLAMTLAAEAPDLDILWLFRGPVAGFQHHRGITHTFLGAPFVALVVTGAVWLYHRSRKRPPPIPARWGMVWLLSLIAVLSHIFLDWTNNYGVRPFFPFDPHWYALSIVFIFEPVIFLGLLLGLVIPAILGLADREIGARKTLFRGRGWAIAAVALAGVVTGVRAVEHHRALNMVQRTSFGRQPMIRAAIGPLPVNPFHWSAIVEAADYFQTGSVDTLAETVTTDDREDVIYKPPVTAAVMAAKRSRLGRAYLDWSKFPVVTDRGPANTVASNEIAPNPLDTAVQFRDLRFAEIGVAPTRTSDPPLSGWVYVAPDGSTNMMVMDGRVQK
jgi:inner membrane protein